MPKNVFDGLVMTARAGFITRRIWREFYSNDDIYIAKQQINRLLIKGYLLPHPNPIAKSALVLSQSGKDFLYSRLGSFYSAPAAGQLIHDEFVLRSVLRLASHGVIANFQFENELRSSGSQKRFASSQRKNLKYPDAQFDILVNGRPRKAALEYERHRKSPERYRDILWMYTANEDLFIIIFVCETQAIFDSLKRQIKRIGTPELVNRIALVRATEWTNEPLNSSMQISKSAFLFGDLCEVWQGAGMEKGVS
jgi:hypothetical protein